MLADLIDRCRRSVVRVEVFADDGSSLGPATGFMVAAGLITCEHVLPAWPVPWARCELTLDAGLVESFTRQEVETGTVAVSPAPWGVANGGKTRHDARLLSSDRFSRAPFDAVPRLAVANTLTLRAGDDVLFLGYPLGVQNLVAHAGRVSAIHADARVGGDMIRIDGSVNGGNSGGPLLNPTTGLVEGIIAAAETGLIVDEFHKLQVNLRDTANLIRYAARGGGGVSIDGVNLFEKTAGLYDSAAEIARSLRRSANVGIGIALPVQWLADTAERPAQPDPHTS